MNSNYVKEVITPEAELHSHVRTLSQRQRCDPRKT